MRSICWRTNRKMVIARSSCGGRGSPPRFSEAYPEATIREGADELTMRAEEVVTLRAFINIDHIEFDRWGPPLVDADGHAFRQAIHKGI